MKKNVCAELHLDYIKRWMSGWLKLAGLTWPHSPAALLAVGCGDWARGLSLSKRLAQACSHGSGVQACNWHNIVCHILLVNVSQG